jgi:predicted amidophosphoribosyltransferase
VPLLDAVLALLVPPACLACGAPSPRAGAPLCPACARAMPWLRAPRCPRCGLGAEHPGRRGCPARRAAFARSWAPLAHDGPARSLVLALKERGRLAAAAPPAAAMAAGAPPGMLDEAALVPVPADPWRRRLRGHDHALALARALGARRGRPVVRCLRRGHARRRAGLGRRARWAGGAAVRVRGPVPPRVVLVDDVHTTGATLDACARALRAAGAREVVAVTATRAGS